MNEKLHFINFIAFICKFHNWNDEQKINFTEKTSRFVWIFKLTSQKAEKNVIRWGSKHKIKSWRSSLCRFVYSGKKICNYDFVPKIACKKFFKRHTRKPELIFDPNLCKWNIIRQKFNVLFDCKDITVNFPFFLISWNKFISIL